MASGLYNRFKYNLCKKLIDLSTDTFTVILLNDSHVFDADDNVMSDINANELANGNGYTTGGAALATPTVTQDDTNDCATFDGADVAWTGATFTAYHAAIIDSSVSNTAIASIDFGGAKSVSAGTFTIQWATTGIIRF